MAGDNHRAPEPVYPDIGGWISGPQATEPVRASDVRKGDVLVVDGKAVTVTADPQAAYYSEDGERVHGLEIVTRDDGSCWCLYRAYGEIVHRVRGAL